MTTDRAQMARDCGFEPGPAFDFLDEVARFRTEHGNSPVKMLMSPGAFTALFGDIMERCERKGIPLDRSGSPVVPARPQFLGVLIEQVESQSEPMIAWGE